MALAADESENWSPVNFAKLSQRGLRFSIIAPEICTRQNDAPACCRELRVEGAVMGGFPFHLRASSHLCVCYASPVIRCAAGRAYRREELPQSWKRLLQNFELFSKLRAENSEEDDG